MTPPQRYRNNAAAIVAYTTTIIAVTMMTVDTNAMGPQDPMLFLLRARLVGLSVIDWLVVLSFTFALLDPNNLTVPRMRVNYIVPICVGLVLLAGICSGKFGGYPPGGLAGPELRGLLQWTLLTLATVWLVCRSSSFAFASFYVFAAWLLVRTAYEAFIGTSLASSLRGSLLLDAGHIMSCALVAICCLSMAEGSRHRKAHVTLGTLFSALVLFSLRRTSILILLGGSVLLILDSIWCRSSGRALRMIKICAVAGLLAVLLYLTGRIDAISGRLYLPGGLAYVERAEGSSNYEHLMDVVEGLFVIRQHPILGAGMGTDVPGRTLGKYGSMIPFHSPHLHSWIRLTLIGVLAYVALQFYSIVLFLKRRSATHHNCRDHAMLEGASAALASYMIFQFAFPPFYLDPKQSFLVAYFLGVAIALQRQRDLCVGLR